MRLIDADALQAIYHHECCGECDMCDHKRDRKIDEHRYEIRCALIDDAPTIDAEPVRHGQWLLNMEMDRQIYPAERVHRGFKCSLCGRKVRSKKEPYCHCGAKMDGGADNG